MPSKPIVSYLALTVPILGLSCFLNNTMLLLKVIEKKFNMSVIYE